MKLYTTPTCGPCRVVKQTMKAEGLEKFVEIIDNPEEFPETVRSVPALDTGSAVLVGAPDILFTLRQKKHEEEFK